MVNVLSSANTTASSAPPSVAGPPRIVAPKVHTSGVICVWASDTGGVSPNIGSTDHLPCIAPQEHPTALQTSAVSFEAQSEPQSVPTLEPVSPV